jgi:hypothetical protein
MWERSVTATSFTAPDPSDPATTIAAAETYCASLTTGGHDDWRLPTRLELVSIQDHSRAEPSIEPGAFPDTPSAVFWSSTRAAVGPTVFYAVSFSDGTVTYDGDIQGEQRVRCVRTERSVAAPPTPFTIAGAIAVDGRTGLAWQRDAFTSRFASPAEAGSRCESVVVDGCGGFRAPTAKELNTIVDETRAGPAVDPTVFPDTAGWYWSSTPYARTGGFWLAQSSGDGVMYPNVQSDGAAVRCVR